MRTILIIALTALVAVIAAPAEADAKRKRHKLRSVETTRHIVQTFLGDHYGQSTVFCRKRGKRMIRCKAWTLDGAFKFKLRASRKTGRVYLDRVRWPKATQAEQPAPRLCMAGPRQPNPYAPASDGSCSDVHVPYQLGRHVRRADDTGCPTYYVPYPDWPEENPAGLDEECNPTDPRVIFYLPPEQRTYPWGRN